MSFGGWMAGPLGTRGERLDSAGRGQVSSGLGRLPVAHKPSFGPSSRVHPKVKQPESVCHQRGETLSQLIIAWC